ncbi:TPA: metal-dependent transcriptional regulator [Staphylococcus aureus]|nr:metal-dependent transcriptional regulator [Staphylococcus aureus]
MLTEEKEDYLKAILTNNGDKNFVTNKILSQFLNIKPPSVSEMVGRLEKAEILEHRISDLFVERLDSLLNFPETCPHGGVIPRNNEYKEKYITTILNYEPGDIVTIKRVRDKTDLLIYLSSKDISIGNEVEIVSKDEMNKVIIIKRNDNVIIVSYENAMNMFAEK